MSISAPSDELRETRSSLLLLPVGRGDERRVGREESARLHVFGEAQRFVPLVERSAAVMDRN